MLKFFSGLTIFIIACILQFSFMPSGVIINFIFATLIAFSFVFSSRGGEPLVFLFFVLAGVFLMNWMPAPSIALAAFAAIPVLTYIFSAMSLWEPWTGVVISLLFGFTVFYLIAAPRFILISTPPFLTDLFIGSAFGLIVFLCMDRVFE